MARDGVRGLVADPHQVEETPRHRLTGGHERLDVRVAEEILFGIRFDGKEAARVLRLQLVPQLLFIEALAALYEVLPSGSPFGLPLEILGRGFGVLRDAVPVQKARHAADDLDGRLIAGRHLPGLVTGAAPLL